MPAEVRDIVSTILKEHSHALAATAVAYERAGFVSAIVRSLITAINIASAAAFRSQVSDKLSDAVAFVTQVLGGDTRRRALLDALNAMRTHAHPTPGRLTRRLRALVR